MSTSREMVKGFITHLFCTPLGLAITSVVAGLALVIARRPSTKTIRKLWGKKKGLLLTCVGMHMAYLGPQSEVGMGQGVGGRRLGFCFYWGQGWRPRVSQAHYW